MTEQTNDGTNRDDWTEESTGDGGSLGVPSTEGHGMPAGNDIEQHEVVSGGGVVDKDDIPPEDAPETFEDLD